jgi:sulfopyruvate decarboxylase subunit beta
MNRQDVIRTITERVGDDVVLVANIADASFELCQIDDRPRNFYMLGSFGLASSIALGLTLGRDRQVIAIDGDGALLYNLGTLATTGRYRRDNLLHVIVDNGAHGATGYQPTATSTGLDLAGIASACGSKAMTVDTLEAFGEALTAALDGAGGPDVIVVKVVEKPPAKAPLPPYTGQQIRERFMTAVADGARGDD